MHNSVLVGAFCFKELHLIYYCLCEKHLQVIQSHVEGFCFSLLAALR